MPKDGMRWDTVSSPEIETPERRPAGNIRRSYRTKSEAVKAKPPVSNNTAEFFSESTHLCGRRELSPNTMILCPPGRRVIRVRSIGTTSDVSQLIYNSFPFRRGGKRIRQGQNNYIETAPPMSASIPLVDDDRTEDRRVGKEWVRTGRFRWSP